MNQPNLFDQPDNDNSLLPACRGPKSPCCRTRLQHLHAATWRCPACNHGWTLK